MIPPSMAPPGMPPGPMGPGMGMGGPAPEPGPGGPIGGPMPPPMMPPMPMAPPPPPTLHDVTVIKRRTYGCARVEPVPPEEFGWARETRRLHEADYCFHEVVKAQHKLIEDGFDEDQINELPSYTPLGNTEATARDTVDEGNYGSGENLNRAVRLIQVTEHYIRLDYEGDGKACLYRVTTGGSEGVILKRDGKLDIIKYDMIPFAIMSPVIVTHRLCGRSIADLVMDIQKIKTALLRAVLDNAYLSNNPRPEVAENGATEDTLDDLLVWRPGAPIRVKVPGTVAWQQVPPIAQQVFPVMEYMDAVREWRTGVTKQGQGIDANSLQNQSATAVNQMFTAAQARLRLIARIFAETGIRDMFSLLHATIRKHSTEKAITRLRGKWVTVDPRVWKNRDDMVINVGLGTGDKSQAFGKLMQLIGLQMQAAQHPEYGLVDPTKMYNSAKDAVRLLGGKTVDLYFTDPKENPNTGQEKPDPAMKKLEAEMQLKQKEMEAKAQIEQLQAQADVTVQQQKSQSEMALAEKRFELERELKMLDAQIKMAEHQADMQSKQEDRQFELHHKAQAADLEERLATRKMQFEANATRVQPGEELDEVGELRVESPIMAALERIAQLSHAAATYSAAPRRSRLIRGADGKPVESVSTIEVSQ